MTSGIKDLITRVEDYLPQESVESIEGAYEFAAECHEGQTRASGGPYIEHPLQAALVLADMRLDQTTISAALLHDVVEDCGVTHKQIQEKFGTDVASLVDGVTKLTRMDVSMMDEGEGRANGAVRDDRIQAESLRKMLVAMAEDIRVVLIKLADRLHNMKTLGALNPRKRKMIAQETLDIYTPLAHRLGIWEIKWQLEDLAFRHIEPSKYKSISRMLNLKRDERENYIKRVAVTLSETLEEAGVSAQVMGRPKHIYSIFKKMEKYQAQGMELSEIYDLYALRVLVKGKDDCYASLGVVHNLWHPMPGQFDDYIAAPKENFYQSLHTTVMCEGGAPLEVQIRTQDMHQTAEYGVAAHWRYKEGGGSDPRFETKMAWLRQLLEWQRGVSGTEEFLEGVKTDLFRDQVFVYTPKGEIIELPSGSTPIDFAYKIHTELGHRCIGSKVNGRLVALDYQLNNGDTVEIHPTKAARGPSLDWLNPSLGYVRTAGARQSIRLWFRRQARGASVQRGRDYLRKELRRLSMSVSEADVAKIFKYDSPEEFLAALGSGTITDSQVASRLMAGQEKRAVDQPAPDLPLSSPSSGIKVLGVGDLLTRMARCCNPIPGEEIVGYITRATGITVHKKTCPNLRNEDEKERLVSVDWGEVQQFYPVRVTIVAWDRVGLLRDVTTQVSEQGVNIAMVVTSENPDGTATMSLTLSTTGVAQLSRLFSKLEGIKGVLSVTRYNESPASSPS